jgi:parallel beta-helix repeat protein
MRRRTRLRLETLEARLVPSTFYVAPTGNDHGAGTSQAPWRTLQHAVDAIAPGDAIRVESGTYAGCRIGHSGQAGAVCTLEADAGAQVVINTPGPANQHNSDVEVELFGGTVSYWVLSGLEVANSPNEGIDVRGTTFITVQNCYVHDSTLTGIFLAYSDNALIQYNQSASNHEHGVYDSNSSDNPTMRGNVLHDNANSGVHMNGDRHFAGDGLVTDALVEQNIIYNNGASGGSGINCDGVQDSVIENNLLYNNHASGISLYRIDGAAGSDNNIVVNNTVLVAADGRWALNIENDSTGNTAYNNILYDYNPSHGSIAISSKSLPGFTSDYNVVMQRMSKTGGNTVISLTQWRNATGQDKHSIVATPAALFVNPAGNDYHLSSTSPAIDAGTATDAPSVDLEGNPRPVGKGFDIGAYEYQGNAGAAAVVTAAWSPPRTQPADPPTLGGAEPTVPTAHLSGLHGQAQAALGMPALAAVRNDADPDGYFVSMVPDLGDDGVLGTRAWDWA